MAAMGETSAKNAESHIKIYGPELQLILYLRQQRKLLADGESVRFEIEIDRDFDHIDIANQARFRRTVLAA